MLIGIHFDKKYSNAHADKCLEYFKSKGIEVKKLNLLSYDALNQVENCDGVIWRWEHNPDHKQSAQKILYAIENGLNIPVFPDSNTSWHYDEKVYQYYVLKLLDAPTPKTWLFWEYDSAIKWLADISFPIIFKLSSGAGSSNVLKINSKNEAMVLIKRLFTTGIYPYTMNEFSYSRFPKSKKDFLLFLSRPYFTLRYLISGKNLGLQSKYWKPEINYAYFQEYLPDNLYDTRITVIGDCAFGFRRFNRKNDFRASGSGIIDYSPEEIDKKAITIAFNISKKGQFQSMAYDFLIRKGNPVICEISYSFTDTAVYNCPGHWNSKLEWNEGQIWPEHAQMDLFLKKIVREKNSDSHNFW